MIFMLFTFLIFLGGFRSAVILCGMIFLLQFFIERVHQTRVFPVFILAGLVAITLIVPFANKLPIPFQRALAFLPLKIDPWARADADASQEWRLQIWKDTLPTVPQYLLLGKGYALSQADLSAASNRSFHYLSNADAVGIVGNWHSGPLSIVIPFGIWGVIALFWFWTASGRALFYNYRYGDSSLRSINIFLFAYFLAKIFSFLIVFGAFSNDMLGFAGIIGLSISINGGIRKPALKAAATATKHLPAPARQRFQPSKGKLA
jgi:hypothetical protein